MKHDEIRHYSVEIKYKDDKHQGSGVIIKPNNESYYYILTAKHTFKENKEDSNNTVSPNINNISIDYFFDEGGRPRKEGYKLKCCDFVEIENYDLAILILKKQDTENQCLGKISRMSILDDDFKECMVVGYPASRKEHKGENESYSCKYDKTNEEKLTYEITPSKPLHRYDSPEQESIEGLSGGGVFAWRKDKPYLVGIQIQIREPSNFLCINLIELSDKINEYLDNKEYPKIEVVSIPCSEIAEIDLNELKFDELLEKLNNEKIGDIKGIGNLDKQFEKIKDNHGTKSLKEYVQETENRLTILAETYLYRGLVCHKKGDNRRATRNFNKAIKYRPNYKIYFLQAKDLRKNNIDDLIKNSSSPHEKQQTISLLEQNIKLDSPDNELLEKNCLTLLKLYEGQSENNIDSSLVAKKGNILEKLGDLYNKRKDYAESEKYFSESIELSKDLPEELIRRYRKLIEVLYKQEKYLETKKCCFERLGHLKEHGKNGIQHIVTTYNDLVTIGYKLKEKDTEIYDYYQCARKELNRLPKNSKQYQRLSKIIETRWLIIKSCVIKQHISSDNELRDNIEKLKSRSEYFSEQQQFVKEQMERVEQQLGEIKESIKKLNNS